MGGDLLKYVSKPHVVFGCFVYLGSPPNYCALWLPLNDILATSCYVCIAGCSALCPVDFLEKIHFALGLLFPSSLTSWSLLVRGLR